MLGAAARNDVALPETRPQEQLGISDPFGRTPLMDLSEVSASAAIVAREAQESSNGTRLLFHSASLSNVNGNTRVDAFISGRLFNSADFAFCTQSLLSSLKQDALPSGLGHGRDVAL
jgi:hypothetical protein